jgi:small conductance mechanosensitive channel
LVPFISSLINILLKVIVIISVASMVGIATTSFVAVLGAAGLAIGLALQGSLANFAGGVLILLLKPFKVDDVITADGETGTVKSITIFNTYLTTFDQNTAIIPNGVLANNKLTNFSSDRNRRMDLQVGVSYNADIEKTIILLYNAMLKVPGVVDDPAPMIGVLSYDDSGVTLAVRPYCKSVDYWDVYFRCNLQIKTSLDAAGVEIPFPQRDLHIKSGKLEA